MNGSPTATRIPGARSRRPTIATFSLLTLVGVPALSGLAAPQPKAKVPARPASLRKPRPPASAPVAGKVAFNRDIRPILSDNCFACHGPDKNKRMANLRLDVREDAVARGALVPGKPERSSLIARILAPGARVMPPPSFHKTLTADQKSLLKRWVAQGAVYEGHWSYVPPQRPPAPKLNDPRYPVRNPIDALVRARLKSKGLLPSPEADRRTLIRRLYFDVLGLPPTPEEVAAFVSDRSPTAYEQLVDRTLANPHYGERMALGWLDVVRYADTIGYHSDTGRNVWPYRDWVIKSFNENKPFDRFTIEQVAGDLLPDANQSTRVGSAFNRLLLTTEEGGAQAKDYEARMLTDRVRAVGAAWLGQTTGCAQCHDHKFDPISARDFYTLGAFFADIQEPIIGHPEEGMLVTTPEQNQQLAKLDAELATARGFLPQLKAAQPQWEMEVQAQGYALPELAAEAKSPEPDKNRARQVVLLLKKPAAMRKPAELGIIETYFRTRGPHAFKAEVETLTRAESARNNYYNSLPKCLTSISAPNKRTVRILPRGNWQDESGEVVKAALPHYLPQPKIEGREPNRLDLAQWLVSRENPLTARTVMNRTWKQFFGTGLSKVLDDLGAQGEPPVNPALLDWLACEFMDSGWNVKHMVRTIVTSATYRQVSTARPDLVAADPYNREMARQSAFRLDAELVRDNALAISGLLVPKLGGPSVKPYQPAGYWENLNFPVRDYIPDQGENQYRRGLYTWWQRSFMHPSLLAFDAPSREECTAERTRSNIPQQALVLLNDPSYVEASRAFAARILREAKGSPDERIAWAWQRALQRNPRPTEARTVRGLFDEHLKTYRANPKAAGELLKTGFAPTPEGLDPVELAAWTHVSRVLLNLHETITRN
ncbi:MAG: PSD1 and planctomycete cytochrome C domain-containing protein [Actinomycetota bacterium]